MFALVAWLKLGYSFRVHVVLVSGSQARFLGRASSARIQQLDRWKFGPNYTI